MVHMVQRIYQKQRNLLDQWLTMTELMLPNHLPEVNFVYWLYILDTSTERTSSNASGASEAGTKQEAGSKKSITSYFISILHPLSLW